MPIPKLDPTSDMQFEAVVARGVRQVCDVGLVVGHRRASRLDWCRVRLARTGPRPAHPQAGIHRRESLAARRAAEVDAGDLDGAEQGADGLGPAGHRPRRVAAAGGCRRQPGRARWPSPAPRPPGRGPRPRRARRPSRPARSGRRRPLLAHPGRRAPLFPVSVGEASGLATSRRWWARARPCSKS